jgi:uncharacterized repeat protein (TIGR01451 family)
MGFDNSMKFYSKFRMVAMLAAALMAVGTRAEAQGMWLNVIVSANPVVISNNLTLAISVTNLTGASQTVVVTNTMPATAQFVSVGFGLVSYPYTVAGSNVTFIVGTLTNGGLAQMGVTIMPTATGTITNTIVVTTNGVIAIVGPVPIQVTNPVPATQADLAVAMTGPAVVFTNDWVNYAVNVTNLGPASASNVMLTNTLPPNVRYITNSPSSPAPSIQGSNVVFNLGTLASNAFINFQLTVQTTNAGALTFVSAVTTSVTDPNTNNNTASLNITVTNYFAGQLTVVTNSKQIYNPQNGLVEQSILLSNTGTNAVASVRVVVTGLSNQLFNAWGTNNGNPFVVYAANFDTNQGVSLLLQYVAGAYFPLTNSQLHAFAVSVPNLTPPPVAAVGTNLSIARIVRLATNRDLLIEFPSLTNRTYTVVYSDNVLFSNAMTAMPSIVAPANRTQWIDYGPPTTVSHPTNAPDRFYRVFLNP